MKPSNWIPLTTALLFAAGCSSQIDSGGDTGGGKSGSSAATTGATTSVTTGAGVSASSGGPMGDVVTLTMTEFTVPPGGEVYKCQNFANPFGADADVSEFESHMTQGSHHLLLFYKDGAADAPLEDCSGLEFAPTPYSTQLPDDSVVLPDGVAALVPATSGMRLQSHYLNVTGQPITAKVTMSFHLAKPGTVKDHAGVLFVVDPKISIPPGATKTIQHNCLLPYDMNIIKAGSHMHKHGTDFVATIGGETIFQTSTWDEPKPALFAPAKAEMGGSALHFECTFKNDTAQTLTFGESASTNEMCIFVAAYYPVPDPTQVTVGCP